MELFLPLGTITASTTQRMSVLGSKVAKDVNVGVHSLSIALALRGISHAR